MKKLFTLTLFTITLALTFSSPASASDLKRPEEIKLIIGAEEIQRRNRVQGEERTALETAKYSVSENPDSDIFTITSDVRLKDPEGVGMCMKGTIASFNPWSGSGLQNVWNVEVAFEPIVFRWNWIIDESKSKSTEEYLEHLSKVGPGYWGLLPEGFFNGATFSLYRNIDNTMKEIHRTKIKKYEILQDDPSGKVSFNLGQGSGRIWYEDKGPVAQKGDVYVITMVRSEIPPTPKKDIKGNDLKGFSGFGNMEFSKEIDWKIDETQKAPEGGSTTSLCMEFPEGNNKLLGANHYYFALLDKWFGDFTSGKSYKAEVWLRGEGLTAPVTFNVGFYLQETLEDVSGEWKKYTFDIPYKPREPFHNDKCRLLLGTSGSGKLWVDNLIIYQTDVEPFAVLPKFYNELKSFKPSVIRWQNGGMDYHPIVDAWLNEKFREQPVWKKTIQGTFGFGLPSHLKLCKDLDCKAWLNTNLPDEKECLALMEYLCGPADTPYGKRRLEIGQERPWAEELEEIIIEVVNEPWNGMFKPLAWDDANTYSALCNMIFANMKKSPYYEKYKDKILFCAAGWGVGPGEVMGNKVVGWTGVIFDKCKEANMTDYAHYIGGWDGRTLPADNEKDLFQFQLLYPQLVDDPQMEKGLKAREFVKRVPGKSDNPISIGIYEFGPGYALPNGGTPYIVEAEFIGKSLALGVATLDTTMNYLEKGFSAPLAFFKFGGGVNFNTHSDINLTRPAPAYLALKIRNLYCNGDMMQVNTDQVKKMQVPDMMAYKRLPNGKYMEKILEGREGIEMTRCYAFQEGKEHAILLLNRNVDETRKVTLKLPFDPAPNITIHKLTGKPGDNNIEQIQVEIQEETRSDFSREYTLDLPACSVYCISATEK